MAHEPDGIIDYGATPSENVGLSGDANINALIYGTRWVNFDLTYSSLDNENDLSFPEADNTYADPLNALQETALTHWLAEFADVSGLSFTRLTGAEGAQEEDQEATIRLFNGVPGEVGVNASSHGFLPGSTELSGDIIIGSVAATAPNIGNFGLLIMGRELGHALGLANGHEVNGLDGILAANVNSVEYSIMTDNMFIGHDRNVHPANTAETWSNPQSLMMYDIAAIQHIYGANFGLNSGITTYTFDTATGEMFINGVGQGTPGGNQILRTIWDGDGVDTYNFSNYTTDLNIDLTPGGYSDLDVGGNFQRADLGANGPGVGVEMARGHVFNALQYQGDTRSLIENATGGIGNDIITGNAANNLLRGGGGNDVLNGGVGNDNLIGDDGADTLNGGDGDDLLAGGAGADILNGGGDATGDTLIGIEHLFGSLHDDTLGGTDGANEIYGLNGRDIIYGYGGSDNLQGGDEVGAGDYIVGGSGNDRILAGGGDDTVYGGSDNDTIFGQDGRDIIYGDSGDDVIDGGDEVGAGDFIAGGTGSDELNGNGGDDTIYGGADNDTINGGTGRDILYGDAGNDLLIGGDEDGAGDVILGGAGNDGLVGGAGDDILNGEAGSDQLQGGAGSDILYSDGDDQSVSGGTGYDYLIATGSGGSWLAQDIEEWYGSSGDDVFLGFVNTQSQIMFGYDGADTLRSGSGADYLIGGNGDDVLIGNQGDDQLYGDAGADQLTGGLGSDILYFDGDDTVVSGGDDYDYAIAQSGSGAVTLNMTAGAIEFAAGSANGDILSADGYNAEVTIYGGGGGDSLYAGTAGSVMFGEDGADQIVMGTAPATDHMLGGTGADTFWMRDGGGTDYIYDFEDGVDIINATLLTSDTAQGVGNFTINTDYVSSGWYGVGYEGGNILWIQAGQDATIDDNDFIFAASGNDPAPEAMDMFDFDGFDSAGNNYAPLEALVAEYDDAVDMPGDYHDMDGHYGPDAGHWDFAA